MCIIAFITDAPTIHDILVVGEPTAPPRIAPARGPPLWEQAGAEDDSSSGLGTIEARATGQHANQAWQSDRV